MEKILQVKKDSILIETETIPALMKNTNVHMLNKQSIEEHYDTFMEIYS